MNEIVIEPGYVTMIDTVSRWNQDRALFELCSPDKPTEYCGCTPY